MEKKYVELLNRQIDKVDAEGFDLDAWKSGTIAILSRVFGETDARIHQVDQLKIDYSSWMLRDSNSNYKPIETAKKKGVEILKTAIDEIEIFGKDHENDTKPALKGLDDQIQKMTKKEKEKYFQKMKKEQLVKLLIKLTQP